VDGKRQWCHANHLRKYHDRATDAVSSSCAVVFDADSDFGEISSLEITDVQVTDQIPVDSSDELLPSQRIDVDRIEVLKLLDEFASCSNSVITLWDPGGIVQTDVCFERIWMALCEVIQRVGSSNFITVVIWNV
jgi:hypothetical protein